MEDNDKILQRINAECEQINQELGVKPTIENIILTIAIFFAVLTSLAGIILSILILDNDIFIFIFEHCKLVFPVIVVFSAIYFWFAYTLLKKGNIPIHRITYNCLSILSIVLLTILLAILAYIIDSLEGFNPSYNYNNDYYNEPFVTNTKLPEHILVDDEILENQACLLIAEDLSTMISFYYIEGELYFQYSDDVNQATFKAELLDEGVVVDQGSQLFFTGLEGYTSSNAKERELVFAYWIKDSNLILYSDAKKSIYVGTMIGSDKYYFFDSSDIEVGQDFVIDDFISALDFHLRRGIGCDVQASIISANCPFYEFEFVDDFMLEVTKQDSPIEYKDEFQLRFCMTDRNGVGYYFKYFDFLGDFEQIQLFQEDIASSTLSTSRDMYCFFEVDDGHNFVRASNAIVVTPDEFAEWLSD